MTRLLSMFTWLAVIATASSCSIRREEMFKGHPTRGTGYIATSLQLGGQYAIAWSSGTKDVTTNEKSFADFLQATGIAIAGWTAASVTKAKEVTSQLAAKEITKQEAQKQLAALQQAELAAKSGATSEAIKAGAEIAPITITAP